MSNPAPTSSTSARPTSALISVGRTRPSDSGAVVSRPPARAERGTDRHLLLPRRAAGEQQVRDVGAADEQHQRDRAEQHEEWRTEIADDRRVQGLDEDAGAGV